MIIRRNEDGSWPTPAELGIRDYYHDQDGKVDMPTYVEHDWVDPGPDPSVELNLEPPGHWEPEPNRDARRERARRENHRREQNAWYEAWLENWN